MDKDLTLWKFYAEGKEKSSYYFDKILIYLSAWWFIFSVKFVEQNIWNTSYLLKFSRLCFLISIVVVTTSYYFSEKAYEKTFDNYQNLDEEGKNICKKCTQRNISVLKKYNFIIEVSKLISLFSFVVGLVLLLLHYRRQ